jgi:RNA polymerase sigma-70 factor (ECF subfamily)
MLQGASERLSGRAAVIERRPESGSWRPDEEASLLERLRQGDETAYETLVRETSGRLLAVARRLLRDEDEARDAVQEAFLAAFRSIDRFHGTARLSTWLHRITVNAALMRLRRRSSRPEESIEELLPKFLADGHHARPAAEWSLPPDHSLAMRELRLQVRGAIDRLPETYRTVLLLRDIEGLSTGETAKLLGASENAVKIRLHRARQALRTLLEPLVARPRSGATA